MAVKSSSQITITDITDAYSVFMDSEAFTFNADNAGAISGSCVTNITAMCGTTAVAVSVTQANIKFYDQSGTQITTNIPFTATVTSGNSGKTATITFTAASGAALANPVEAEIPISVDSTITATKRFTLAAAKTGAAGQNGTNGISVTGVQTKYQLNNTSTAPSKSSGTWTTTPSVPTRNNKYLWAYDITSYSSGSPTETAVRLASQFTEGSQWYSGTALSGTGTGKTGVAGVVGDQYLNSTTGETYRCTAAGTSSTATWDYVGSIKGATGAAGQDGADGADAIAISITTNNGTVFKNNSGSTKMTAHVFKGGVEQSVVENTGVCGTLGTVKWYKGLPTDTQPSGWPQSKGAITISATDVTNAQAYTCQLES
jgi:hypothetical protein